jgi:CRP/FNR family transcriptional regulator, cyclic AMP receptor protein
VSTPPDGRSSVVKVALKRADLWEIIQNDAILKTSAFVVSLLNKAEPLLRTATARRYPDRAILYQQGDQGNALYFVLKGDVRLSARQGNDLVDLGTAARGDVFGETEVLSGSALRTSAAVAHGDVDVAEIPRDALLDKGLLLKQLGALLRPLQDARKNALSDMADFMNRW